MKTVYKYQHDGLWCSRKAHEAWLRGERPAGYFYGDVPIILTQKHHIGIDDGRGSHTRRLVMFAKPD